MKKKPKAKADEKPPEKKVFQSQINDACNQCGACLPICPTKSIYQGTGNAFFIDSDTCTSCLLCAMVCPVAAITNPGLPPPVKLLKV